MDRKFNRSTWFNRKSNTIQITGKANSFNVKDFSSALTLFKESESKTLTLDFSRVLQVYPNGMLPIICTTETLRLDGISVYVKLPKKDDVRRLFRSVNWAHFLSPKQFDKSESSHDRHLVTRFFTNETQQHAAVNDFMDVVLRNMEVPKDIISGLEWSMNEITDNVLNHSQSKIGGIVQASTYPKSGHIAFAVADSGRGILTSLQEGIPTLRTDLQAMGEAIKSGVTRNPKYGQGNGLAGSLKITTLSGGSLEITSGRGRMVSTPEETRKNERTEYQSYSGTVVCGQININKDFSISEALDFGQKGTYVPVDIVEMQYEMEDKDCLILNMKDETTGFGSRRSGGQIRTKVNNLINAKPNYPMVINWEGVPVISSSFADELIGKLFLKMGAISFSSKIRNVGMEPLITQLLDKAVSQRLTQALDEENFA